jgi:phospholipid/cholesterol/gamma-HCH transport system substrate-binding protein
MSALRRNARRNAQRNGDGPGPRIPRKKLFEIQPGMHRPKLVRNGAIFTVFVAIFLYIIYTKPSLPLISSNGTTIKADFAYAADVVPGRTPVRVLGVDVGTVTGISRTANLRGVQVTMTLNDGSGVTVKQDASASLRWRTLLGLNYYVDLTPGSTSAPALGQGVIPENRTSSQVELDQALQPLNAQGRHALTTMIDQFDAGFADPSAVRHTIQAAAPAMQNLGSGLPGLRGTVAGTDLPGLVTSAGRWMGAAARNEAALGGLIDNGVVALGVTAAQRLALGSTVDSAPGALQQTEATMARLRTTLATLNPIAQRLVPGVVKLDRAAILARTALSASTPLLSELKPTLAAIRPSVNALARAAAAGVPVIASLTPTLDRVQTTFLPFLNRRDPETKLKEYQAVGPAVAGVSSAIALGDRFGTLAGFEAGFGENAVAGISPCSTSLLNPTVPLQNRVDCQALVQMLQSIFTGSSPATPTANSPVPAQLVTSVLGLKP